MAKVILVLKDDTGEKFKGLMNPILLEKKSIKKIGKVDWKIKESNTIEQDSFTYCGVETIDSIIYVKNFKFKDNSVTGKGKEIIDKIEKYFIDNNPDIRKIDKIFISVDSEGITEEQLTAFAKKSNDGDSKASGVFFYNFGKSYLMNLTFTDTDYAEFENNISHEAINVFKSDDPDGKRYFYLCDDGKLNGYFGCLSEEDIIPDSYFNFDGITLLNYSKLIKFDKQEYVILQKIEKFEVFKPAFRGFAEEDYTNIKYYDVKLSDILKRNKYEPKKKNSIDPKSYPLVSFELKQGSHVQVTKPGKEIIFKTDEEPSQSLTGFSCKRMLIEGTSAYNFIHDKVKEKNIWAKEKNQTLGEYIKSKAFKYDEEKENVLNILNKDRKETFFTLLIGYCFKHSKDIFASLFKKAFQESNITIENIEEVNCEKYNIDVSVYFKDQNEEIHLLVLENKIDADFTKKGEKDIEAFFNDESEYITEIKEEFEDLKRRKTLEENQLTKYYKIAKVIGRKKGIKSNNIHFLILGPEYRKGYCELKRKEYYYGEDYKVVSYKDLYEAISKCENNKALKTDVKDIIKQLKLSIWPYINDSATYYKRRMKYRFARVAQEIRKESNQ